MPVPLGDRLAKVSVGHAADLRKQQVEFFKKLDNFTLDDMMLQSSAPSAQEVKEGPWLRLFRTSVQNLRRELQAAPKGHTVVLGAAAYLLRCGLLNVKGTKYINIKQGRALLHWAWWLQRDMSQKWVADGLLPPAPWTVAATPLFHVLIGGAGTGKTTTQHVINALIECFHGADSVKKSAPTNTAARLGGGDTTHAVYKLPRGTLLGRRGKLSPHVLAALRKCWRPIRAQSIDEISFLPPQSLFQIDFRSRQAKQVNEAPFGGLATSLCGDFLQLTPVDNPSLATPLDDQGFIVEPMDEGVVVNDMEVKLKERRDFEHRNGFELWRERFTSVTCLTLNMRTTGVLADVLQGMREGKITDVLWNALQASHLR